MLNKIKCLWALLSLEQRRRLVFLQIMVVAISIFELLTIGMIAGFMGIVSDNSKLDEYLSFVNIAAPEGISYSNLLLFISSVVLICLTISSILSVVMTKKINQISFGFGHELTFRLFSFYQTRDWIYYVKNNSSDLSNKVLIESSRLVGTVLVPTINMLSRLVFIFLISIAIFSYDIETSFFVIVFFISSYVLISALLKKRLHRNSRLITETNQQKSKIVKEAFTNTKAAILLGKRDYFINSFEKQSLQQSQSQASTKTISGTPKYMMEWLAYVSMIMIIILNLIIKGDDFSTILPLLTIYGLAAFKLLPSLQQVYNNIAIIKGNISVLDTLKEDMVLSSVNNSFGYDSSFIPFESYLEVSQGCFSYNNDENLALNSINLKINKFEKIGVVGHSGSGKSTLIDVLCGLLSLNYGSLKSDGQPIEDLSAWHHNISYVPQSVSLLDSTIAENIAFGVDYSEIDWNKVNKAVELSCLNDLIDSFPNGLDSQLGENGIQISGGQRQRISIARALYAESDILIFDEATSALDGITENQIMESIEKLSGKKTIVMIAHRLKTIKNCDRIYFMKKGKIVDEGSYKYLMENNAHFREMDKFA
ncbi:ABC transporter ATP-binding protein [Aliivibrio fischeri]|uniref:ABC transporter ATP-binding protein n=1 Tax=Aliivibrio fischeri TaxID=668 RepID=UPI0012DACFD9|nr:ABC transporter ATP-binding protein [Aliivibrio fischeri]MUL09193.1 ATP-binding cassette domain-containing protein [Aliivibrio fischeri]MUL13979.1 ATP-binding cassette domain-containing protein [Aliivibrio fischeri]